MPSPHENEVTLEFGDQKAVVSTLGASLRRYFRTEEDGAETDIVWGYRGDENKIGGQGDVLMPFPSRIRNGRYVFNGETHQMPINDKAGNNAIHGFLREAVWEVETNGSAQARFHTAIRAEEFAERGYPFSLTAALTYTLSEDGLACEFMLRNDGDGDAPVGVGFHPYFTVGTDSIDDAEALIPANRYLEFEPSLVPTGNQPPVEGTPLDFRTLRRVGSTVIDNCYADLMTDDKGYSYSRLRNPGTGRVVTVWADETFPYIVVFTGDTLPEAGYRKALAIEPMTCATDAFNHPEWGLKILSPGEEFYGRFGVWCEG
jgi:aldose 1-epimerase